MLFCTTFIDTDFHAMCRVHFFSGTIVRLRMIAHRRFTLSLLYVFRGIDDMDIWITDMEAQLLNDDIGKVCQFIER